MKEGVFELLTVACVAGGFVGERGRGKIPQNFVRGMGRK